METNKKEKNTQDLYLNSEDLYLFEFHGWRKFVYWLGWLNALNLIFWLVVAFYYNKYRHLSRYERNKKLANLVYAFGYFSIGWIVFCIIANL